MELEFFTYSSNRDVTHVSFPSSHSYEDERTDYKSQPPNNTIMVRGLAQHITENDVSLDTRCW